MRVVFFGTPHFAVTSLRALIDHSIQVEAVVTATDKPGGRGGRRILQSAVKTEALEAGLPVLQPSNLKDPRFLAELRALKADLHVVVAYRMLPEAVWNMPPMGTVNVHASLLPAYRGAAPINWAIIRGEKETGVTTFLLQHAIDTGDLLMQRAIPIEEHDTAGTMHDKLMTLGAALLIDTLKALKTGTVKPVPQDHTKASHAPKLNMQNREIDFNQSSRRVTDLIRGLSPYPAAWTTLHGKLLKIYAATPVEYHATTPGTWVFTGNKMICTTKNGAIECKEVQWEGKRKMSATEFLNGYRPA